MADRVPDGEGKKGAAEEADKTAAEEAENKMAAEEAEKPAAKEAVEIKLPAPWFPVEPGEALCWVVPAKSRRGFGAFEEKTLKCNPAARSAIDQVCAEGGFTQSWERPTGPDGL